MRYYLVCSFRWILGFVGLADWRLIWYCVLYVTVVLLADCWITCCVTCLNCLLFAYLLRWMLVGCDCSVCGL